MVTVEQEKCNGCGMCRDACPQEAIALLKKKAVVIEAKCVMCGTCIDICTERAMQFQVVKAA